MIAEWNECNDVYELGQILVDQGVFNSVLWRKFHCRCCRSVWDFVTDNSKAAIYQAELVVANQLSASELEGLHQEMIRESDVAWSLVNSLKIHSDSNDAIWPLSDDVDEAWCSYLSAECAKVVTQSIIAAYVIPEPASSLVAWARVRREVLRDHEQESRELVESRWKEIRDDEERKQASILRGLWSPSTK